MKLGLIFGNDWELCGDGSGDYFEIQHRPLQALTEAMANHGATLTVMAEVGQQWAHQELGVSTRWAEEIALAWEDILRDSLRRGMDVQLHFHPQWLHAAHDGSRWQLDLSNWALSSLSPRDIERVLCRGKQYLESLLKPVRPTYECIAFRAGAYCIEPSHHVIPALRNAGIKCDTSVTKGQFCAGFYDYRDAFSNVMPWITGSSDITRPGMPPDGILEMPIYSVSMFNSPALSRFLGIYLGSAVSRDERRWFRESRTIGEERYPLRNRPFRRHQVRLSNVRRLLLRKSAVELDYDTLPADLFVEMISRIFATDQTAALRDVDVIVPVVASGHVKQMHNTDNVNRILAAVTRRFGDDVVYWSMTDAALYWIERLSSRQAAVSVVM